MKSALAQGEMKMPSSVKKKQDAANEKDFKIVTSFLS